MGISLQCNVCHKYFRTNEINDCGTSWQPSFEVQCPFCGTVIQLNMGDFSLQQEDISKTKKASIESRAKNSDIREYWIQLYIKYNYSKLGLESIEGPFDNGPDFIGVLNGKKIKIEAERDYNCYISHGHDQDKRFADVKLLIVLNPQKPQEDLRHRLPQEIMYIDIDDFVLWYRKEGRKYHELKEVQRILYQISNEFKKLYIENCPDKERDMSTCPYCELCAYNDNFDTLRLDTEAKVSGRFVNMALMFLMFSLRQIDAGFDIREITRGELEEWFFMFMEDGF